jgi:putative phage-type endonuclease
MKVYAPQKFNQAKLVGLFESGTSEWHEARADSIGGSEVGTIMGLNPWESAYSLMAKKLGLVDNPPLDNWSVRFGQKFEQPILDLLQEEHPDWELYTTGTYSHAEHSFMHANPDALAKVNGEWVIVEVKTSKNYWYEIPPQYLSQVRHYMAVMNVNRAVIVGVVNMSWVEHWVDRDEFEEQILIERASEFYQMMKNGEMPSWDGSESTFETVRKMHPLITDDEVEIEGAIDLVSLQEKVDAAQAELNKAKSQVLDSMGTAKHAFIEIDGEKFRVASRQARGLGMPYLVINKKGK